MAIVVSVKMESTEIANFSIGLIVFFFYMEVESELRNLRNYWELCSSILDGAGFFF